jgi:hypothetical protein
MLDLNRLDLEEIATALADQTDHEHRWLIDPHLSRSSWVSSTPERAAATGTTGHTLSECSTVKSIAIPPPIEHPMNQNPTASCSRERVAGAEVKIRAQKISKTASGDAVSRSRWESPAFCSSTSSASSSPGRPRPQPSSSSTDSSCWLASVSGGEPKPAPWRTPARKARRNSSKRRSTNLCTAAQTDRWKLSATARQALSVCSRLALLAGISRSGVTMVGGLLRGLDHADAAKVVFLLATPVILAAGVLKIPSLLGPAGADIHGQVIIGALAAGLAAYISVRFLTRYFTTRTLTPFAV